MLESYSEGGPPQHIENKRKKNKVSVNIFSRAWVLFLNMYQDYDETKLVGDQNRYIPLLRGFCRTTCIFIYCSNDQ